MYSILHLTSALEVPPLSPSPPSPPPPLPHREVKKETFLSLADYYISTAMEMVERLDGRPMMVGAFCGMYFAATDCLHFLGSVPLQQGQV